MTMLNRELRFTASNHSLARAKERAGLNAKRAQRVISLALYNGKSAEDYSGKESKYLQNKSTRNCTAVAYQGFCMIISDTTYACVTMYQLPNWFGKSTRYDGKEKIRNLRKYNRMHINFDEYIA